jgi:hypothetical protein
MGELHFTYVNAKSAGYKANICQIGNNVYDPLQYWVKRNFADIEITRPTLTTDLSLVHNKSLFTVNGYVYPTECINSRLFVPNATKSMLKSRSNHLGLISFNRLTDPLVKHRLTVDQITPDGTYPLYEKCVITLPDDIRTPMLIIGGYIQLEEPDVFYRLSSNSYALSLSKLAYMERLYETQRYRDIFEDLEIPTSVVNISMVDATVARSDATILKYLTCFNSFLVDVPVDTIQTKKIYLNRSNIPSTYQTDITPSYPLITGYGKLSEYSYTTGPDGRYNVNTIDAYYSNHLFSKLDPNKINVYNDHRAPGSTYRLSNAYMLDMFTTT